MKFKNLITAASIALLPLTAGAATLVIPAAGSASGANGSTWKSELTLHNTSSVAIALTLDYHDQAGATGLVAVNVPAHRTISIDDVVRTQFGRENTIGAIEINLSDADLSRIAITSRTYNVLGDQQFGQDIPAIRATDAIGAGDVAVISGPNDAAGFRFNAGLYTLIATTVKWELVRADGTVAASQTLEYAAGVQNQYSVESLLGTLQDNDVVHANVIKGSAIFYGSVVNNASGDPSFVPGIHTRQQSAVNLLGIDRDENGTIDIPAHDNILDSSVDAYTIGFPTYFRIVTDQPVTFEIVSSTADARLIDNNGTIQMVASAALAGKTGTVQVRATTTDGQSTILTIPVKFF